MACFLHWMRLQFNSGNVNTGAEKVAAFIRYIYLHRLSVRARLDFEDELCPLCIDKLRLTWRWVCHSLSGRRLTDYLSSAVCGCH
ncbi:hypothetical protein SCLCIDRAFT_1215492 [Scleroderma citrinum Foug A]|uniref:Uncharacterized protein n=1 Tax=Scleroderma citrinum Foug A TaxID=1036808 RepID=A0A0C3E0X8_9AGAM|nr:hypothetical protein SCLCIDRAFT_1215492 [Scleroderma citrinum Foug A]